MCMKRFGKWASAVLAGILLAVPAAASDILLGDVNVDGIVNRKDAMTLRRYWAGWEGYEYITAPSATDINQDGILNADDADAFSRYFAGDSTVGELVGQMVSAPLHYMMMVVATDMDDVAEDGLRAPSGYVALRIVNEDGSLQDELYYARCTDMNLYGHMDEMALGQTYQILCDPATAEDGILFIQTAVQYSVSSARMMTVTNNGITDNDGLTYTSLPISSYKNWCFDGGFYLHQLGESDSYSWKESLPDYCSNPYAKIHLYDTDNDGKAEAASYKDYRIGYFRNTTMKCFMNKNGVNHNAGTYMPAYQISSLEGAVYLNVFAEAGHEAHNDAFAWINVDPTVTGFVNDDGTYNNGVVIFNYNTDTGELEIVKYISPTGNNADADSFIATGLLQGYSTVNTTVTINGMKYLYGYDSLPGNTLCRGNGSEAAQSVVKAELDKYMMAIVTYLVVDGKVVDIDLLNSSSELISVIGYAGITSDGYVAVHATSTANPQPMIYRILSFNGASSADDPIYDPETSIAFQKGTIYTIKSYEPDTDSYSVNTHTVADLQKQEEFSSIWINLTLDNGYAVYTNGNKEVLYSDKISGNQDFLIIDTSGNPYFIPGTSLQTGYWVQGTMLLKTPTLVVIEANPVLDAGGTIIGHMADGFLDNAYTYEYIRYDEANAFTKAPDLSSNYDLRDTLYVNVYDLAANAYKYVLVPANIDLVDGQTYEVLNNMIIGIAG